jgi:hypothetical protein
MRYIMMFVALLLSFTILAVPQNQPLAFAAVSIKPEQFVIDRASPSRFVCHGTDGTRRPINEYLGPLDLVVAPQGRCVGNRVRLETLIGFAYGIPPHRVLQLPDWAQITPQSHVVFHVEAVAEVTSTATVEQLRQMVQTMLADRFKLSELSQRRTVRLGDSEAAALTIVFEHGKMVEILCPKTILSAKPEKNAHAAANDHAASVGSSVERCLPPSRRSALSTRVGRY